MTYRECTPCRALRENVACYWTRDGGANAAHRVLPDGCIDVLFDLTAGTARVIGPMSRALVTAPDEDHALLGVRFRPGEAIGFLGAAADEFLDGDAALDEVWSLAGREIADAVASARGLEARVRVVERVLLVRKGHTPPVDRRLRAAICAIASTSGATTVRAVAARTGLNERQLERWFHVHVGYGPKTFARVMRLQRVVSSLPHVRREGWTAMAAACGYADQAHLVRELRALAGVTPTALAREHAVGFVQSPSDATE